MVDDNLIDLAFGVFSDLINFFLVRGFIVVALFEGITFLVGLLLLTKPSWAIEFQRRFYLALNWKVEPVSMSKEIRNTRVMGASLIVLVAVTVVYMFTKSS